MYRFFSALCVIALSAPGAGAGELCLGPSHPNGLNGSTACDAGGTFVDNDWRGFTTSGVACTGGPAPLYCIYGDPPSSIIFCWSISASILTPDVSVGPIGPEGTALYLWLDQTGTELFAAAEFYLEGDLGGGLGVVSVLPVNGFEIVHPGGDPREIRISSPQCPGGPTLAAVIQVAGPLGVAGSRWGDVKARYR